MSDESAEAPPQRPPSAVKRLEEEGDAAADYLEELLDIADLDGDLDLDIDGDRAVVSVVGADVDVLVGSNGEVLEAVQELTRLAVLSTTGERSRLMLDIGGYRAERRRELEGHARAAAQRVRDAGQPERLAPMSAFERKVVHDTVASEGLGSASEGEGAERRVVISPAGTGG
jgi:spoIIIJ-associated protein